MLSFKSFLGMLLEDRIGFLKQQHVDDHITGKKAINSSHDEYAEHRDSHAIIDHFSTHADPSKKKLYTQWIVNRYHKGNFRQEDAGRIHTALSDFDKHKSKLPHADINQYKSLSDVETAVAPHAGTLSGKEEKKLIKSEGADLVHDSEHATVHRLKTQDAACQYGAGTKWCTAAKNNNMFDTYHKEGPLYVVQGKNDGRKYQMHFESDQFMDEQDHPVDLHHLSKQYGLHNVPEFEHKHAAFMKPHNLKNPDYLLKHQETIARTGTEQHINDLLDAAK